MDKKMWVSIISLIIAIGLFFVIWIIGENKNVKNENLSNNIKNEEVQNIVNISSNEIKENKVKEQNISNEISTQNNVSDNNTHYLIKSENGYINIYYLDEENREYLYKKTTISVNYLSEQDVEDLSIGIEVIGIENLNETLENFE